MIYESAHLQSSQIRIGPSHKLSVHGSVPIVPITRLTPLLYERDGVTSTASSQHDIQIHFAISRAWTEPQVDGEAYHITGGSYTERSSPLKSESISCNWHLKAGIAGVIGK